MNAAKFIVTYAEFRLVEDDWKEGESLEAADVWTEDVEGQFSSIEEALKRLPFVKSLSADDDIFKTFENDPCGEDDFGRFDADFQANDNACPVKPTAADAELWQRGLRKLFSLHVSVRVKKIADVCRDDVARLA